MKHVEGKEAGLTAGVSFSTDTDKSDSVPTPASPQAGHPESSPKSGVQAPGPGHGH